MSRARFAVALTIALSFSLGLTAALPAQSPLKKMLDRLSGRKRETASPPLASQQHETEQRMTEILIELVWLGDPITFPYYLDARVEGPNLRLRGNVPSPAVHQHAVKLARMNTPLPVADSLKENPRVKFRPTRMSPERLQNVVKTSLRQLLPQHAKNLTVRCTADGKVTVAGTVDNFEQKLEISRALRRLHGCTVAINQVRVGYDLDGSLANGLSNPAPKVVTENTNVPTRPRPEPIAISVAPSTPGNEPLPKNNLPGPRDSGEDVAPRIVASPGPAVVSDSPAPKTGSRLSPAELQKLQHFQMLVKDACPRAKEVRVSMPSPRVLRVDFYFPEDLDEARRNSTIDAVLSQLDKLREVQNYRTQKIDVMPSFNFIPVPNATP